MNPAIKEKSVKCKDLGMIGILLIFGLCAALQDENSKISSMLNGSNRTHRTYLFCVSSGARVLQINGNEHSRVSRSMRTKTVERSSWRTSALDVVTSPCT